MLKNQVVPKFFEKDLIKLEEKIKGNYDIILLSNVYNYIELNVFEYTKFLKQLKVPEIQALYDWHGFYLDEFTWVNYDMDVVRPSAPNEFALKRNFVFSLKKRN